MNWNLVVHLCMLCVAIVVLLREPIKALFSPVAAKGPNEREDLADNIWDAKKPEDSNMAMQRCSGASLSQG